MSDLILHWMGGEPLRDTAAPRRVRVCRASGRCRLRSRIFPFEALAPGQGRGEFTRAVLDQVRK
jgi:hypothetical protein